MPGARRCSPATGASKAGAVYQYVAAAIRNISDHRPSTMATLRRWTDTTQVRKAAAPSTTSPER